MASDESALLFTEADYRRFLKWRLPRMADEFTQLLPPEARQRGMRFEFTLLDEEPGLVVLDPRTGCYRTAGGQRVHFVPSCRCPR